VLVVCEAESIVVPGRRQIERNENIRVLLRFASLIVLFLLVALPGCLPGGMPIVEPSEYGLHVHVEPPQGGTVIIRVPEHPDTPDQRAGKVDLDARYPPLTKLELKAVPAFGYSFSHWNEDAWGSKNPFAVTLYSDHTLIYAHFKEAPYSLRVILSPPEGGIVEVKTGAGIVEPRPEPEVDPGDPSAWEVRQTYDWVLPQSETVTLTATPLEGYRFVAWASDNVTIENPHNPTTSFRLEHPTTVIAYFALVLPEDAPPEEAAPEGAALTGSIKPRVEIIEGPHGCISSILYVDYEARDLTGGDRPVDYVQLNIDGQQWSVWQGVPTEHYQDSTLKEVDCEGKSTLQLKATNTEGQEFTITEDFSLPPLAAVFTHRFVDITGEDCRRLLVVDYQARDLTIPDGPITNVVLRGNGQLWKDSGKILADHYQYSFQREVFCDQVYTIEVTATDADGNKYTYRDTVRIPAPEPQDEPAEPDEPDEPPAPPPPQQTLYAAFMAQVQSIVNQQGCSSTLTVSFDGKDLTGGQYPITSVKLKVTGPGFTKTYDSKPVQNPNHHDTKSWSGLACGQTFNIEVTVTNSIGQTVSSTGSITTPIP